MSADHIRHNVWHGISINVLNVRWIYGPTLLLMHAWSWCYYNVDLACISHHLHFISLRQMLAWISQPWELKHCGNFGEHKCSHVNYTEKQSIKQVKSSDFCQGFSLHLPARSGHFFTKATWAWIRLTSASN